VKADCKVVLVGITLPPNYGADYIRQFDAIFPEVASRYHVALLPMLYAHVYQVQGAIQDDGVHPTAKGAQMIAGNILPLLLPLLRR
jgi:acyl-CoA thioesterase-1